jgi:Domain of unknown function (DUF4430)
VRAALVLAVLASVAFAGCGLGSGKGADGVSVVVTRDYGERTVGSAGVAKTPGSETVMRFLERKFKVQTRYGGGFVQSIDGLAGGYDGGRPVDWFYYVNGIEAAKGAAATRLHAGDRVWWDRHDWGAARGVPAVVGSFPEPFRSGAEGKRLPLQVACTDDAGPACEEAERRLVAVGVKAGSSAFGTGGGTETLRVLVGPWKSLRADPVSRRIEQGPGTSGVFARFSSDGRHLTVLDDRGRRGASLGAGAGLVAATRLREQQPTWVVTGTDAAGTLAAARALREGALRNRFAVAVEDSRTLPVPVGNEGGP